MTRLPAKNIKETSKMEDKFQNETMRKQKLTWKTMINFRF